MVESEPLQCGKAAVFVVALFIYMAHSIGASNRVLMMVLIRIWELINLAHEKL